MSQFEDLFNGVIAKRCDKCFGSGKVDDAEPGDISFREWDCPTCKGTGTKPETDGGTRKR